MAVEKLLAIVTLSCLFDGIALWTVLFTRWERLLPDGSESSISVARCLLAALLGLAVFVFKLPVLIFFGLDLFGLVHVAYVDLVILLPFTAILILYAAYRGRRSASSLPVTAGARRLAWLCLTLVVVGIYATFVEPFRLQLEVARVELSPERQGDAPVRLGVLADLQTRRITDHERRAVDRLLELEPDVILVLGDLYQGERRHFGERLPAFRELVGRLRAPGGVFVVPGNTDRPGELRRILQDLPARLLENERVELEIADRRLTIGGVGLPHDAPAAVALRESLEQRADAGDVRLLVSHYPDVVLGLDERSRVDLVVAGHTHGGQVCIPGLGPITVLSEVPRSVGAGGLSDLDGRRVYVSRGVGCERGQAPRIRFFCPPDVSLVVLE